MVKSRIKNVKKIIYWKRAKRVIPSGNSFLSKNPTRFPVKDWPIYFLKSKGCQIWSIDNKKYYDFCYMGVGTNVLGYSNPVVDGGVKKVIQTGNMTTLNSVEEFILAEKLIKIHPWAQKVKFARTGAEANSIAVRIARAKTEKEKIIVCGYHGWHDWYLSANLNNRNNLDTHLFPNLKTAGVPKTLKNSVYSILYNDFDNLKKIIDKNKKKIACLIMEVERDNEPKNNFLRKVRDICTINNIILIFDECTTGFRETFGGIHLKYKIYPDMAMFGKALGNGYAITAVIGKNSVMEKSNDTFMSSTFWSERIGYMAGIKTLEEMYRKKSWKIIKKKGLFIRKQLIKIAKKNGLELEILGLASLFRFKIKNIRDDGYIKFLIAEMLKRGFLSTNVLYVSTCHSKKLINLYLSNIDKVFNKIKNNFL
jgi:glutamate-1-semialdehyde aminotransferase